MSELVEITHTAFPGQKKTVSVGAYEELYKPKGWKKDLGKKREETDAPNESSSKNRV